LRERFSYVARALGADAAEVNRPRPTPEEQQALNRWAFEYERAHLEGWGKSARRRRSPTTSGEPIIGEKRIAYRNPFL
jgi:hypothetical protein